MIARVRRWLDRLVTSRERAWEAQLRAEARAARHRAAQSRRRRKIVEARLRASGAPPSDMVRGVWPHPPRKRGTP